MDIDTRVYFTAATMIMRYQQVLKFLVDYYYGWWYYSNDGFNAFAVGFLFLFTMGGVTGVILANAGLDIAHMILIML